MYFQVCCHEMSKINKKLRYLKYKLREPIFLTPIFPGTNFPFYQLAGTNFPTFILLHLREPIFPLPIFREPIFPRTNFREPIFRAPIVGNQFSVIHLDTMYSSLAGIIKSIITTSRRRSCPSHAFLRFRSLCIFCIYGYIISSMCSVVSIL